MTALGHFIRNRRKALGLTQTQLARRIGVDDGYISAIERGMRTPDGCAFLDELAKGLDLDMAARSQLASTAKGSKRYIRLPDQMPLRKHEVISALVRDMALTEADIEAIAGVHAAIVRNRSTAAAAQGMSHGGSM